MTKEIHRKIILLGDYGSRGLKTLIVDLGDES